MKYFWLINDIGTYICLEAGSLYECIRDTKTQIFMQMFVEIYTDHGFRSLFLLISFWNLFKIF